MAYGFGFTITRCCVKTACSARQGLYLQSGKDRGDITNLTSMSTLYLKWSRCNCTARTFFQLSIGLRPWTRPLSTLHTWPELTLDMLLGFEADVLPELGAEDLLKLETAVRRRLFES